MKDYIVKNSDNSFSLTSAGEKEVLTNTSRKLASHYLTQALGKTPGQIQVQLGQLEDFIQKNFSSLNDLLGKFSDLSIFIGEKNIERFQKFMGQYFLQTYQKEKTSFLNKQIESNRDKLSNPYWTPSCDLLKIYGQKFETAPPLELNAEIPDTEIIPEPEKPKIEEQIPEVKGPQEMPGEIFLKKHANVFVQASPLQPIVLTRSLESEDEDESPKSIDPVELPEKTEPGPANTDPKDDTIERMPGDVFLERFALKFNQSPKLDLKEQLIANVQIAEKLFSIRAYASILSQISKFNKAKDMDGYKNWYSALKPRQKAVVKINSLLSSESKGNAINWGNEMINCAAALNENKNDLYKLSEEIKIYGKILHKIRFLLGHLNPPIPPAAVSNIYSQVIILLNDETPVEEKIASMNILLLQVADAPSREKLSREFVNFINVLS